MIAGGIAPCYWALD